MGKKSKRVSGRHEFSSYFNPKHPGSFSGVSGFIKNNKKRLEIKFQVKQNNDEHRKSYYKFQ